MKLQAAQIDENTADSRSDAKQNSQERMCSKLSKEAMQQTLKRRNAAVRT